VTANTDLRLRAFVTLVALFAFVAALASYRLLPITLSPMLGILAILMVATSFLAVELPNGSSVSIGEPLEIAAVLLFGPTTAAILVALTILPDSRCIRDKVLLKSVFNVAQMTIATLVAGWTYVALGGRLFASGPMGASDMPRILGPLLALSLVFSAVNSVLVSSFIGISNRVSFLSAWREFSWGLPADLALAPVGLAFAQVAQTEGAAGLALFVIPLLIARQFYQRYTGLRSAYAGTIRSLVAVIEAKDPYTRGHSERVASYATAIAGALKLRPERVEQVELAALLHDLGKVGVSRRILVKDGQLDSEEFSEIERHPAIGAHIIESVPFLADLAPLVLHHHERPDGAGYGEGLSGDQIPIEARILAVADCYDAMTSTRPYRAALTKSAAAAELERGAGSQFDPAAVRAFLGWLERAEESALSSGTAEAGGLT
jgi:HD-GYP domain-containing protein (c-di-GMP phosphodiesterase class II)